MFSFGFFHGCKAKSMITVGSNYKNDVYCTKLYEATNSKQLALLYFWLSITWSTVLGDGCKAWANQILCLNNG